MKENLRTILRCTGVALVVVGALVLLPAAAEAQCTPGNHGVSIFKSCVSPKNSCATDADCSDGVFCNGPEQCATETAAGSNVVDCTITLTNPTIHCDDLTVTEACDAITGGTGSPASSCDILVISAPGGTGPGCDAGSNLGGAETCTLNPGESIQFRANYYTIQPADPDPLGDQATVTVVDTCSGGAGGCSTTPSNAQFTASTDLQSGCSPGTPVDCPSDGNVCDGPEFCDEAIDACNDGPDAADSTTCGDTDGNACTTAGCDGAGTCDQGHVTTVCTDDSNVCNGIPACNPANGLCEDTDLADSTTCGDTDGNACTTAGCDGAGTCDQTHNTVTCNDDGNVCNGPEACVPATGLCDSGPDVICADPICTVCTEATGVCDPIDPLPAECQPGDEICRTPGFWGTHAGTEKESSIDITGTLITAWNNANDPNLNICGREITNADSGNVNSALEAICVSVKGDSRRQLARQLMAGALNCIITNSGDGDSCVSLTGTLCGGVSVEEFFTPCNAACAAGDVTIDFDDDDDPLTPDVEVSCIGAIDCFNNGGNFDPTDGSCDEAIDSCHDRDLDNGCFDFQPPGAAGSPKDCNVARKNEIFVPIPVAP